LQTTSFANRQLDPVFQLVETPIFIPEVCKASLAAIPFTDTDDYWLASAVDYFESCRVELAGPSPPP
jgi:hypothetical protein